MKSCLPFTAILGGVLLTPVAWSKSGPGASSVELGTQKEPTRSASQVLPAEATKLPPNSDPEPSNHAIAVPVGPIALASVSWSGTRAKAQDSKGHWFTLTLDRALQQAANQLLRAARPSRGAIVVLSVVDNRVLALAEFPNPPSNSESLVWAAVTPSASLFKLVTTAALVESAQLQPNHRVCSEGGMHRLDAKHLTAPTEGQIVCSTFSEILAASRNAAYARLVHHHLTPEELANFADRFGFNSPLPADVPAELGRFQLATEPLRFARTATGFVGSSLSALGAAHLALVIANGGVVRPLRLLTNNDDDPTPEQPSEPAESAALPRVLSTTTATRLREMMEKVVSHGTAADAFRDDTGRPLFPHLRIAGKTGTLGRDERTASWFVGFAPSRAPKLVVAVVLDNGPVWQTTAKHVASSLLREYFEKYHGGSLTRP